MALERGKRVFNRRLRLALTTLLTGLLLSARLFAAPSPVPEAAIMLHRSITSALVAGDLPRAAEQLPTLATCFPPLSRALHHGYLQGLLLEDSQNFQGAVIAYQGYLAGDPQDLLLAPYAHLRLALLREADGQPGAAAEQFHLAAELGGRDWPDYGEALSGAIRCASTDGNCGDAARYLRRLEGRKWKALARRGSVDLAQCLITAGEPKAGRWRLQLLLSEEQGDDPALDAYLLLDGPDGPPAEETNEKSMFSSRREEAWYMGNAAYRNRRFDEAVDWLERLLASGDSGDDPYQDKATFLLGRCRLLQGDFPAARQWFLLAGEQFPKSLSGQDGLFYGAVCHLRLGDNQAALEELRRLVVAEMRSAVALKALVTEIWPLKYAMDATGLDRLTSRAAELGLGGRSTRARILMHLADVQRRAGDVTLAMTTLHRVITGTRHNETIHAEATLWLARLLRDADRLPEALHQCLHLSRLDVPYLFRHQARIIASGMAQASYADQDQILLQGVRNLMDAEDHTAAREELEKFLLTCGWSGKRQVALNLLQEQYRREVPYSIPFWVRPMTPSSLEAAAGRGGAGDGLRRAAALLRIGCFAEAAAELDAASGQASIDRDDRQYAISVWSMLGGNNAASVRAAERLTRVTPPAAVQEALPLNIRLLLYPGHFYQLVSREAEARELDPLLVLALLREESRFGSGVRSGAAARGLMQIIPETAAAVSARHGIDYAGPDDLYLPEVSIAIGTAYLSELLERYQGNAAAALAAYNGGEANADRWLAAVSDPSDPFDFIREVTFRESRNYVIKVLSSYRAYQALDTKLVGHTSEIVRSFVDWDLFAADMPTIR